MTLAYEFSVDVSAEVDGEPHALDHISAAEVLRGIGEPIRNAEQLGSLFVE